jgi:uncharacterized protein YyaL (SSP411 family)
MEQNRTAKITWSDWTDEAFQRAKSENKPVLLDISAVWCHWCHRLDQDTYSVPDVAEYIETHFIPIRVDTDKRPDINRRYNMGGWPTTAFLTPDGRVIGGGTYFPPEQMRQVLRDIHAFWERSQGQPSPPELALPEPESIPPGELSPSIIEDVLGEIANNFDAIYGGFGSQPKFPNTEAHELSLLKYHYSGNREFLRIVTLTLRTVGTSGVYDKEAGGFFRYSTLRDWSIPHFEKMCEDNAKWLQLFLHAYEATEEGFYANIAKGIIEYVNTWLSDRENGCFYGSQDADEEYYRHSKAERSSLSTPYVDRNIYTDWNAAMISAYLETSYALGDLSARDFAFKSLERLLSLNYMPGKGLYHFFDGKPHLSNQLADQVWVTRALSTAYECSGDLCYLGLAEDIMASATTRLYDAEHGGFFDTIVDANAPGFLSKPAKPLDENSVAARALIKLYHLTGKENYRKQAEETLKRFVQIYPQFGFMAGEYALAVDALLNEPTLIHIIGSLDRPQSKGLLAEAHRVYEPRKIILLLDPQRDQDRITALGYPPAEQPTAYICVGRVCTAPIVEPRNLAFEIDRMTSTQFRRPTATP